MHTQSQAVGPLYDLLDGLSRRRRLRALCVDPDQVVMKGISDDGDHQCEAHNGPLQKVAAE
jgi:hypothetical protein